MKRAFFILFLLAGAINVSGQQWYSLPDSPNGTVYSILPDTSNNLLYVGGNFVAAGGSMNLSIAAWNGNFWSSVGTGIDFMGGSIYSLEFYNNQLIAAGDFTDFATIAEWDGSSWSGLGNGFYGSTLMMFGNTTVWKIKNFDNKLFLTGAFRYIFNLPPPFTDTINSLGYWDNVQFNKFTNLSGDKTGLSFHNTISGFAGFSLGVHNNDIYVGGQLDSIAGNAIPSWIAKLDSTGWTNVGQNPLFGWAYVLFSYNGELFAGGQGPTALQRLVGNTWVPLGQFSGNVWINAMCEYKGDLVVAGTFDSVDNVPAIGIARWNGSNWSTFGSGIIGEVWCLDVFQGDLYAGGSFNIAGGIAAPAIAKWSEPLGINEGKKFKFDCYPNPVSDKLNIISSQCENGEYLLTITNILNQPIFDKSVYIQNNHMSAAFDFTNIAPGIYFLNVFNSKDEIRTIKIIKN